MTRVEDISTLLCGTITVSAAGEAARFQSKGMGKFRPTGQFSAGRQVFYNRRTRRYLSVQCILAVYPGVPGTTVWKVMKLE